MHTKKFSEVKNTVDENAYKKAIEEFLTSNGADLEEQIKVKIKLIPDEFLLFNTSEDGLEISLKNPDLH